MTLPLSQLSEAAKLTIGAITDLESLSTNAECRAEWWLWNPFNCTRFVLLKCFARGFPLNLAYEEVRRGGERLKARTRMIFGILFP